MPKPTLLIIGSGIAGLSAAYELVMRGQSVIVLDRGAINRRRAAPKAKEISGLLVVRELPLHFVVLKRLGFHLNFCLFRVKNERRQSSN